MHIGDLRHRVTVQTAAVTRDAYGGEVLTWSDTATVWAAVEPLAGREFLEGRGLEAAVDTRIRIRYGTTVVPKQRVVWGDHTYDVEAVLEVKGRRREVQLICRELVE